MAIRARHRVAVLASACLACDPDGGDADTPPVEDLRVELAAPLTFELTDGQVLRLQGVELADGRQGELDLHGEAVDAVAGQLVVSTASDANGRLVVLDPAGAEWTAASRRSDRDDHEAVDAELVGLTLSGFDRAVFFGPRGPEVLHEPIVLDAFGLSWTAADLHVVVSATPSAPTLAGPSASRLRHVSDPRASAIREDAHAQGDADPEVDGLAGAPDVALALGDPCQTTPGCGPGAACVADASTSDGAFRCLAECVGPAPDDPVDPLVVSTEAVCVDDGGCCDASLECRNGSCVSPDTTSDHVTSSGGGCDPDDDDVISACDAHPNESCKADADGDGCANSFDDDDSDSCRCAARVPRLNGMGKVMLLLGLLRGRRRRVRAANPAA